MYDFLDNYNAEDNVIYILGWNERISTDLNIIDGYVLPLRVSLPLEFCSLIGRCEVSIRWDTLSLVKFNVLPDLFTCDVASVTGGAEKFHLFRSNWCHIRYFVEVHFWGALVFCIFFSCRICLVRYYILTFWPCFYMHNNTSLTCNLPSILKLRYFLSVVLSRERWLNPETAEID